MSKKAIAIILIIFLLAVPAANAVDITAVSAVDIPDKNSTAAEEFIGNENETKKPSVEKELTEAIGVYKTLFGSTDDYENFNSYVSEYSGVKTYSLSWSNNDYKININAEIGIDGKLYSYSYSDNSRTYQQSITIPSLSKTEAINKAYEFIIRVSPEIKNLISKDFAVINYYNSYYSVQFYSVAHGISINNESVYVNIDKDGAITSYNRRNISNNIVFPGEYKSLPNGDIMNALKKEFPFKLVYRTVYPNGYDKPAQVKLYYQLNDNYYGHVINGTTGELLKIEYGMYTGVNTQTMAEEADIIAGAPGADGGYGRSEKNLTEAEKVSIEILKTFITVDDAAKILKSKNLIDFGDDYYVYNYQLHSRESIYTNAKTYYWNISYRNKNDNYVYTDIDALTGEIYNLYAHNTYDYKKAGEYKYTLDDCKNAAEKYLGELYPGKIKEFKINDYSINEIKYNDMVSQYYFSYSRYVNGIAFSDNIYISINPDNLKVFSLSFNYSDAKFPATDNIITADKAADKYWSAFGLTPEYTLYVSIDGGVLKMPYYKIANELKKLLPTYRYDIYCFIDAKNGKAVEYNDSEITVDKNKFYSPEGFTDIAGHKYEKEIKLLYDIDCIKLSGNKKFYPDNAITYSEFANMLTASGYYTSPTPIYVEYRSSYDKKLSSPANNNDQTPLTRVEAIKLYIEVLGYDKIAGLKGIFKVDYFKDADKIADDMTGYVAIAYGLGILDGFGDSLSPMAKLTKGEAAYLISNYISLN